MEKAELKELEEKVKALPENVKTRYFNQFSKQAMYMGNGTYSISGLYSTNTEELFLMYVGQQKFKMQFD